MYFLSKSPNIVLLLMNVCGFTRQDFRLSVERHRSEHVHIDEVSRRPGKINEQHHPYL